MNGENRFNILEKLVRRIHRFQKKGNKAGIPVMTMDNIRFPSKPLQGFKNAYIEKNNLVGTSFQIVSAVQISKKTISLKIFFVIQKICLNLARR